MKVAKPLAPENKKFFKFFKMSSQFRKLRAENMKKDSRSFFFVVDFTPEERGEMILNLGERIYKKIGQERDMWVHYKYENDRANKAQLRSRDDIIRGEIYHCLRDDFRGLNGKIVIDLQFKTQNEADKGGYRDLLNLIKSEGYILKF